MKNLFIYLALALCMSPALAWADPDSEELDKLVAGDTDDKAEFTIPKNVYNAILVMRREDQGEGTGFIVRRNIKGTDRFFVYTNQHVIAGGKNLPKAYRSDGTQVPLGKMFTAVDYDLAIFTLSKPEEHFLEILEEVDRNIEVEERIATPGNAGGGSTITFKYGKVLSIGPELVEVDSMFKGGNSGGPILRRDGKVVGIVAFLREETVDDPRLTASPHTVVRRFGYRVDNIRKWETPDWKTFVAQGERFKKISEKSRDLEALVTSGFRNWNGNEEIGEAMRLIEIKLGNSRNQNRGLARAYDDLKEVVESDLDIASRDTSLYWWWRHKLKEEREFRERLSEHFEKSSKQAKQKG